MTINMYHLDLIKAPISWAVVLLGFVVYVLSKAQKWTIRPRATQPLQPSTSSKKHEPIYSEDAYHNIEPLVNFDLEKEEPLKLRPFKPIYHMTMALENTTLSDLVAMDNTYASRCAIRKSIIQTERHEVIACNPAAVPAVLELYGWLTGTYFPKRFPSIYTLTENDLQNKVLGSSLPLHLPATVSGAEHALQLLGENIDDEFLIMLPTSTPPTTPSTIPNPTPNSTPTEYRLEAFLNCFPSGFNTRSKLALLLSVIHSPVPGYAQKLERSMDRFFASLPVGKIVKRANWSISTSGELFCLAGSHMSEEEMMAAKEKKEEGSGEGEGEGEVEEEIDLEKTVVRSERQTLHRLPETGALVFAFKTYQYPIKELRDEGSGEVLAEAIDGLGLGSVPGITVYKRQVVWGEKVKAFLRGEIDA